MKKTVQISESIPLGIILAIAGGFMDAYSYMCRGGVFANAQTGNMLLFGINLCEGDWNKVFYYFSSVFSFGIGILIAEVVKYRLKDKDFIHWRQISVLGEVIVLLCVSFIPQALNLMANCLTSLACGIQVESFRKIKGNGIATTMCIGNLRSANENMYKYIKERDKETGRKSLLYYFIILCFITGAVVGNLCVELFNERAIVFDAILLVNGFLIMFIDLEKGESIND